MNDLLNELAWIKFKIGEKVTIIAMLLLLLVLIIFSSIVQKKQVISEQQALFSRLESSKRHDGQTSTTDINDIDQFYAQFPKEQALTTILEGIHTDAVVANIALLQGEYALQKNKDSRLLQYTITFPVRAHYAHLKQFIQQTERHYPTLRLKKIVLKRENIDENQSNIELQYQLYVTSELDARS